MKHKYIPCQFRVISINTGREWRFHKVAEVDRFLQGRNTRFYHVFELRPVEELLRGY